MASRVVRRAFSTTDRMYLLTRHFFWLVPLIDLGLFLGFGVLCAVATRLWPRRAGWLCPRLIVMGAVLPALLIVGRGIYPLAWLVFATGIAVALAPTIERHPAAIRAQGDLDVRRLAGGGGDPGRVDPRRGVARPSTRGRPAIARGRPPERAPRRAGYRPGGPPGPVRLRAAHQPSPGRPRPAERPLQPGPGLGPLDARLARQPVHRPMAPRAGHPVAASDAPGVSPPWPNTWDRSATPRPGSSATRSTAPTTAGSIAASPSITTMS